ncbi:alpha/beta hydrolase [Paenalkalicoccus suaedae]|uniref:Alpha/beta hydrolase n=1 Tax=Paenalkalicoccus suaedae TaxID=2592382 RepID=A0A859FE24_9BACI|nr:alpha/beta hydrolase [Paenalkalicoccus suaedae]QKS70476.1 alpha/beta hydrolase [Paenalkalicoccus suaedae]
MKAQLISSEIYYRFTQVLHGGATVILDAGYGDSSQTWDSIVHSVQKLASVFIYDRAGTGKSSKSINPRTSLFIVKELKELIEKASVPPPYILVGHSFGGINMRVFASTNPDTVVGLLLLDTPPTTYKENFLPTMPSSFQKAYTEQFTSEGNYEEYHSSLQLAHHSPIRESIETFILAAGNKNLYTTASQQLWNKLQMEEADFFTNCTFFIVENSSHYVHHDQPDHVINAIKGLIEKKRET